MQLPSKVHIMDVGPRDGFQVERDWIPTDRKIEVINALSRTGVPAIQATSFVHPKAVPQLADAEEVMTKITRVPGCRYQVLLPPTLKGLQRTLALSCKPDCVEIFMSVSESHNRANVNRSVEESMREIDQMVPLAREAGLEVSGGLSTSFGCPFEGEVPLEQLERVVERWMKTGVRAFTLGDTTGVGNPRQVYTACAHLLDKYPGIQLALHPHNTRGMALAAVVAAMQAGVTRFDASVGGLGGCPYAPGATGNVATEDLVNMLHEMGVETGIDLDALIAVAKGLQEIVPHQLESSLVRAGKRTDLKPAPKAQEKGEFLSYRHVPLTGRG
jgi:hydroxymethylglutaryl-CoA lyase